jgi:hypothetical protein
MQSGRLPKPWKKDEEANGESKQEAQQRPAGLTPRTVQHMLGAARKGAILGGFGRSQGARAWG